MSRAQWRIGDRYELFHEIGTGPCGAVWYGRDLRNGAEHAVKVLEPGLTGDNEAVSAFYALLGAVARLAHPHIVAADEVVALEGRIALAMRLVPGGDLRVLVATKGRPQPVQAALMAAQLADGLAAAHAIGVAHGDLKPANVLCEPGENGLYAARLTDFGTALVVAAADPAVAGELPPPEYLAPELAAGDPGTPAGDVYALGILLYETLAGRPPFTADQPETVADLHRDVRPPWIPGLPELLWPPLAACLEKRPESRPAAAELAGLLRDIAGLIETEPTAAGAETGPMFAAEGVPQLSDDARRAGDTMAIALAAPLALTAAQAAAAAAHETRTARAARRRRIARIAEVTAAVVGVVAGITLAIAGTGGNQSPNSTVLGVGQTEPARVVQLPGTAGASGSGSASPSLSATPSVSASPDASAGSSSAPASGPTSTSAGQPPAPSTAPPTTSTSVPQPPPGRPPTFNGPVLVSAQSGKCLDTPGDQFASGTKVVLATCDGSAGEVWNYDRNGELTQDGGQYCLDDTAYGTSNGTLVQIWACSGGRQQPNQQWIMHRNGEITSELQGATNLCLDVQNMGTADGTPIQLWGCDPNGQPNQDWNWQ
jgi:serine/threonine-protein kinase